MMLSDSDATALFGVSTGDAARMFLAGLNREGTALRWQREIATVGWRHGDTSIDMAHGVLVSWTRALVAIDTKSGSTLWEAADIPRDEHSKWNELAITKTRVYVRQGGGGHPLQVRNAGNGNLIGVVEDL